MRCTRTVAQLIVHTDCVPPIVTIGKDHRRPIAVEAKLIVSPIPNRRISNAATRIIASSQKHLVGKKSCSLKTALLRHFLNDDAQQRAPSIF